MKLSKISGTNIKGETFSIDLAAATLFVGGNFKGKSARTDAIRLALLGHLPELGKTARATFGLASGKEMSVEALFEDGSRIFRRWFLKGDSVKTEELLPPWLADGNAELVAVMLNAETYFALSANERVNYVFAHIPLAGAEWTTEALRQTVEQELYQTEGISGKAADALLATLTAQLAAAERTRELAGDAAGLTAQSYVDAMVTIFTDEAKSAKQRAAVFEKTVQGLAHLRTTDEKGTDIAALEADLRRLNDEIAALRDDRARLTAVSEQARASRRRRDELSSELRGRGPLLAQKTTRENRIDEMKAQLEGAPALDDRALLDLANELSTAEHAVRDNERELKEVHASIERVQKEWAEINRQTKCPTCGADHGGWRLKKQEEFEAAERGLATKRDGLVAAGATARETAATLARRVSAERETRARRQVKERELAIEQNALAAIERNLAILDDRQKALDALPAAPADVASELEAVIAKITAKNEEANALSLRRRALDGRQHELRRLSQAEEERDRAIESEGAAKVAVKAARELKARMVEAAFAPLLATANAFFPDILGHPLSLFEGEIGWFRDGVWVGNKTFSGTEKALAYAAIQSALSARAPFKLVLLDELGRLDDVNVVKLVTDVGLALARGDIAQFVGVDTGRAILIEGHRPPEMDLQIVPVEGSR